MRDPQPILSPGGGGGLVSPTLGIYAFAQKTFSDQP